MSQLFQSKAGWGPDTWVTIVASDQQVGGDTGREVSVAQLPVYLGVIL